ncbi:acyltransferase family protein [Moheibacter sediminis]|uniref:Peptidoglycan/LPS O-acetylase OafA/YrhL, contains acyltransferase and SGNH-hydrolase domains n=1 Tax=Moheibacter sediminis TaxID=1434700 RepID=A0A1W2C7W1_9FLAO|nr:acyltransferase [Moheibacter sediminis]SMC81355.1 Peptidoglycan/LPS O-acetylase OafA/YrhL, contains acyltransferase and SGNH-hydrolase domains [Moheibacter sediminis]
MSRRHFHTFDALRFFACLKVFLSHLPITSFAWFSYLKAGGGIGVQFFFVLSGFLISYILLHEKTETGGVKLKRFFTRRILRIWPLFYLMIGFAFLTPLILEYILKLPSSDEGYEPNWVMSLLFLENYQMMLTDSFPNVSPLRVMWSLCIEEHFYIIWGLVFYFIRKRFVLPFITGSLLLGLIVRIIYTNLGIPALDVFSTIDLFAFGAIPAYLLVNRQAIIYNFNAKIGYPVKLLFAAFVLILVSVLSNMDYGVWMPTVLGFAFSILLVLILPEENRFKISDQNIFSKLGVYTYGFYLYHTIVINLFVQIFRKINWELTNALPAFLFFCITLFCSLLCSKLSYDYFEKPFLRLKPKT